VAGHASAHLAGRRSSLDLLATDPSLYTFSAS